ncbi:MAG: hypothetical protein K1Y02_22400 [Candidatus Hydrogenedentes bacterium]|nr:hypothetical protein [Candidatus Hydrogenedentota bacterium]
MIMLSLCVLGFWFLMLIVAILSGGLRTKLLLPRFGDLRAHQIGTVFVCMIFTALIAWFVRATGLTPQQAVIVGPVWAAMTVAFETVMVRFWMKRPWADVFADYNLLKGRVWPLVLLTLMALPYIVSRL